MTGANDIIAENERRNAALDAVYDPITGEGSPIPRVPLKFSDDEDWMVPEWMIAGLERRSKGKKANAAFYRAILEADSLSHFASMTSDPEGITANLRELRCVWDFEYWCATQATIELDADTGIKRGKRVSHFILNATQRGLWAEIYPMLIAGEPVRVVVLKARQGGVSTFTENLMLWIQKYHQRNWNMVIAGPSQKQARNWRKMYRRSAEGCGHTLDPYEGTDVVRVLSGRECMISIASIERSENDRGFGYHLQHHSEVGFWKSTTEVNAENFSQALLETCPASAWTVILQESTARGVGNYFHNVWLAAESGNSTFKPIFIPWYKTERYRMAIDDYVAFINSMDEYDEFLWRSGASLEQINWYHWKLREKSGNKKAMQNEYPTEPKEAFLSSGSPVFELDLVETRSKEYVADPIWRGFYNGAEMDGTMQEGDGPLWIWKHPEKTKMLRRYAGFADFGGKSDKANWSVLTIVDRSGDQLEVVARLRLHLRPDLFAWYCARVCAYYNDAYLAFEINRHKEDRGDDVRGYEPEWSMAGIEAVAGKYRNLHTRTPDEEALNQPVANLKIGFHTNTLTKPKMITALEKALEDDMLIERDQRAYNEMMTYELKPDGKMGAVDGRHDDIVMSLAGGVYISLEVMAPVGIPKPIEYRKKRGGYASF